MIDNLKLRIQEYINNRKIVILGFGKEGRSTYHFLRDLFPEYQLCIADSNIEISQEIELKEDPYVEFALGEDYLILNQNYDLVFKSPGVSLKSYSIPDNQEISSQTDLFLMLFSKQCIGVTGTKGKSTTVSLLQHILKGFYTNVLLIGNIGLPALEVVAEMDIDTKVIYELSSHQLEFAHHSPHIAVLLNLYQEHLDHYNSYKDYRMAKWNIANNQSKDDFLIINGDDYQIIDDVEIQTIKSSNIKYGFKENNDIKWDSKDKEFSINSRKLSFDISGFPLLGEHNIYNLMAVLSVCDILKLPLKNVLEKSQSFISLPHRLEFVDEINGIKFYNDSIATIPEASIKAMESIKDIGTIILGGFDRGIDYKILIDYLSQRESINILLLGDVGKRLQKGLESSDYKGNIYFINDFNQIVIEATKLSSSGQACLFSPAAASYDSFKNFEERGNEFIELVKQFKRLQKLM